MNWLLLFTIFAWVGAVGGFLLGGANFIVWYHYNFNKDGIREAQLMRAVKGVEYTFPRMVPAFMICVMCTIFLVAKALS